MGKIKKMVGIIMAVAMSVMMVLPAMAEAGTVFDVAQKTTVEFVFDPADNLLAAHKFRAYQIFAGTQQLDPDMLPNKDGEIEIIGDITWGSGINGADFLKKLQSDDVITANAEGTNPFVNCKTALEVAEVLEKYEARYREPAIQRMLDQVARIAAATEGQENSLLTNTYVEIDAPIKDKNGQYGPDVNVGTNSHYPGKLIKKVELDVGYYLIVDVTDVNGTDAVLNAAVLQPTTSLVIDVKTSKPTLEKKVVEEDSNEAGDTNNAAINDTVTFEITSQVPDMSHYDYYKFVVSDVLSKGLTFKEITSVVITPKTGSAIEVLNKANNDTPADAKYTYELNTSDSSAADVLTGEYIGGTALRIVFNNFYENYMDYKEAEIKITYTATLNEKAKVGTEGNPNQARLLYWNDPDVEGTGDDFTTDTEHPDPQGISPWQETYTFTTALRLTKVETVDGEVHPLEEAKFKITGEKLESEIVVGRTFVESETGSYYLLADGTYTLEAPTDKTSDKYASADTKYEMVVTNPEEGKVTGTQPDVAYETMVDAATGQILIVGLPAGVYYIEETKAPLGYNKLVNPIRVEISVVGYSYNEGDEKWTCTWTATQGEWDAENEQYLQLDGVTNPSTITYSGEIGGFAGGFAFNVENNRGALLPRTGGIGTTIFYVVGGVLVVIAAVLLVLKRRSESNND